MEHKPLNKHSRLYANIFISLTLTIFVTIVSLSAILYKNFESIVIRQTQTLISNNLLQVDQGVSFITATAKSLATQIYNDWDVSKLLYYNSLDDMDIKAALTQLAYYRQTTPYIDSIYVYNANTRTFYLSSSNADNVVQEEASFYDRDVIKYFENYKAFTPIPRKIFMNKNNGNRNINWNVYTVIYFGQHSPGSEDNCAVIINISEEWISKLTNGLNRKLESNTFLIDKENRVISGTYRYPTFSQLSFENYIKKIRAAKSANSYFIDKIDGSDSFISYMPSGPYGWTIVQITDYKFIIAKIRNLKTNTIFIALVILSVGLLFSYSISRRLYKPINSILKLLKKLEAEKKDVMYTMKQDFLRSILINTNEHDVDVIYEKITHLGIKLNTSGQVALFMLKIDYYNSFCSQYNLADRGIIKFDIMNISTETASIQYSAEAVDMDGDSIILILSLADSEAEISLQDLDLLARSIQQNIMDKIKISVSVTISQVETSISNIAVLYNSILEASLHKLIYGYGCIIFAQMVNEYKQKEYTYPHHKEKQLIDSLMSGKADEAKTVYLEIIEGAKEYPFTTINLVLARLAFSINMAVDIIEKNSLSSSLASVNIISIFSNNVETIDEINEQLFKIFDNVAINHQEKKNVSHDYVVNKAMEIVRKEYMNVNLSIDYIAGLLDMSSAHISRLFKKITLKSIVDYINEVRMDKAREMLVSSGFTIEEVAEKTGFASGVYFYKTFKKFNGTTPGEYRTKNRIGS